MSAVTFHITLVYIFFYKWICLWFKKKIFKNNFQLYNDQKEVISERYMEILKYLKYNTKHNIRRVFSI